MERVAYGRGLAALRERCVPTVASRILLLIASLVFGAQCATTGVMSQTQSSIGCPANVPDDVARAGEPGVEPPKLVRQVFAHFTADAMRKKIRGSVYLRGIVDQSGVVRDVCVERALEPSLDAAAGKAFEQWVFRPATREGEPVPVVVTVQMAFTVR
jgi:TonB family protein